MPVSRKMPDLCPLPQGQLCSLKASTGPPSADQQEGWGQTGQEAGVSPS